jgi:class 3 adenylate cyclase
MWQSASRALARAWALLDGLAWSAARGAVDAVRYQPRHWGLVLACATTQPEVPAPVARWLVDVRATPAVVRLLALPHALVRAVAAETARWFGPTGSALVRWLSGTLAGAVDRAGSRAIERPLRARVHPGLLVPHPHAVAVLALDMRGFSNLTRELRDTQYLVDLIEEYLTALTAVIERHRGVVFQYTGDGLLALFLPELAGVDRAAMLDRLVNEVGPALHRVFDELYQRWRSEWRESGRPVVEIGLGVGLSYGRATIGFIGPFGKKQIGVIGEPVNIAAFLCSAAKAGTVLIDYASFARAGSTPPLAKVIRVRSKKRHQRIETICMHCSTRRARARFELPMFGIGATR